MYVANTKVVDKIKQIGGKNFDAQFIQKVTTALSNQSLAKSATTVINLSSYLPDNIYDYEVTFMIVANTGATSGNYNRIYAYAGTGTGGFGLRVGLARTRSSSTEHFTNSGCLPIKATDQCLTIYNAGNATTTGLNVYLKGYRRIGKNETEKRYVSNIKYKNIVLPVGGGNFDGQWVSKSLTLLSSATISKGAYTTCSLDSYLPKDGYDYEVLVTGWGSTGATSGNTIRVKAWDGTNSSTGATDYYMFGGITRTASTRGFGGSTRIRIKSTDRNTSINNSGNAAAGVSIVARGYRRIGKNNDDSTYLENMSVKYDQIPIGGKNFDGQWIPKYSVVTTINSPTKGTNYTVDISSYLPKDGYAYEIMASVYISTLATSGSVGEAYLSGHGQYLMVARNTTRSTSTVDNEASIILPISPGRKNILVMSGSTGTNSISVYFHGYRRLGLNA